MRGGRMFDEEAYTCTYDLLSFIPSLDDPGKSVRDEIFEFNEKVKSLSRSRLVSGGQKVDVSSPGFSARDRLDLIELMMHSEDTLGIRRVEECFEPAFFTTNFWFMWCTTFAFQPWHSAVEFRRYLLRFIQEFKRIDTLAGVRRTPYNQFDSIVRPLLKWLREQGVAFEMGCQVTNIDFMLSGGKRHVEKIYVTRDGRPEEIATNDDDMVFITLGSMTADSTFGSMTSAAPLQSRKSGGAWALWETISKSQPDFGKPSVFNGHMEQSLWESFTITLSDPTFFKLMTTFTGNEAGTGGLVTFKDSNWLMSVVLPHQPHFIDQPEGITVCWGYGLFPDKVGNYVQKQMSECTGAEILSELLAHLRFEAQASTIIGSAICIPCMMPYITSQFLPRAKGDRPQVVPADSANFAFIGQYCEIPDDVVFTVEYSVRAAQISVYSLLHLDKKVSPLFKGQHDVGVLFDSIKTMFE